MKIYLYKLKFHGATHFGDTGIDLENVSEWVNSDTLFSALLNAHRTMDGEESASSIIEAFTNRPPFLISSVFLYSGDNYFLPRPMFDEHISTDLKKRLGKDLKKLKWLNREGFLKWISREEITEADVKEMQSTQKLYNEAFTLEIRPRVSLDRATQTSNIYHSGYIYFKKEAGLYGFAAFNDETYINHFQAMLTTLGEIGLGGERTYGCGMFKVDSFQEITGLFKEILNSNSNVYTLLSLYHPSEDEVKTIKDKLIAYDIVKKKGWITSGRYALPLKRKSVGFIIEGSVFKEPPEGTLVDVTPDKPPPDILTHKIYRYGYAFTAPLRSAR